MMESAITFPTTRKIRTSALRAIAERIGFDRGVVERERERKENEAGVMEEE